MTYDDFDLIAVDVEQEDKIYEFKNYITMQNRYNVELPYGSYNFKLRLKDPKKGNYKLELDNVKLPFSINLYYEGSRILGGKITKSDNKVNIIEKGLERVKHDKIEYIASEVGSGEFVSLDKMTTGTYEIIPLNPPEGYYVKDAYPIVNLTDEKPYDDVVVEYLKNNGKKVQLTVSDNTQAENSGKYIIYDYKKYLGLDGGKEYLIDSNQTIELEKGRYLVKAISNEDYYAKAINSDKDHLFVTLEQEIEEVEFEYIKYNGQSPITNVKIYIEDSSKSDNYSYNYTLISKAGENINGVFDKDNYRTHYIDLPYGYYELTVNDLQAGYKVKPKSFIISSENAEQIFEIVKDDGDEKIDVDFKFVCEGEVVSPVEFTLDDSPLTNGINKVSIGKHKLQITNLPVYFDPINDIEDVIITENTKDIVIKVNKTNKVIRKITLSAYDNSKKYNDNVDFIAISEDGKEYRGKVYIKDSNRPSNITIEYELPVGEYELHVESFDKELQPQFTNYGKFKVDEKTSKIYSPRVDIFPAYKIDASAKTQYGNEVDLEYKVIIKDGSKIGEFTIDSVPATRRDHEVHAINIPEEMTLVENPLITNYRGSSYFDGAYKPVEFEVIVDVEIEKHQVTFNYGYDDKVQSVEVYEGAKVKEPEEPAREGYEFKGWFTDQTFTEKFDFETLISTDITLYAKWEKEAPKVYEVTFVKNNGEEDSVIEVTEGEKVQAVEIKREGYELEGWYTDARFTKKYDFESPIKENITLYAKWKDIGQQMVTVTLDMQDKSGKFNFKNAEIYVVDEDGKEYSGIITEGKYTVYNVEFNLKKGKYEIKARSLDEDSLLPSHNSYGKFNVYSSPKKLPFEYTVFFWKPTKIDVSAVDQDGESVELEYKVIRKEREKYGEFPIDKVPAARGEDCVIEAINIPEGMTVKNNPIKTTYDNYNEIYKPVKFDVIVDKESKTFNVTFVKNNETDNEVVEVTAGEKVKKPVDPEKEGYNFVGWFTDEELTTGFNFDTPIKSDTNLYAKWEEVVVDPAKLEVTFVKNNETDNEVVEVTEGEKVTKPVDPEKIGYNFVGWFTDQDLTEKFDFNTRIISNTTLYAKWEKIEVSPRPRPDDWPIYDGHYYEPSPEYKPENSDRTELDKNKENTEDETKGQEKPDSPLLIEKPIYTVDLIDIPITEVGDAIRDIVARGILKGTGENKFEPETTITRAMITEVFMRLSIDKSIDKSINFFDIKFGDWYYDSVRWAAAKSIVKGYEDGTFKPNQKITLQEFAVMLHRMLNKFGVELPKVKDVDESDYSYLLDWCKYEVIDLVEADFIEVNQYGEHAYDKEVTREYFAVVMDRLIKYVEENYNTDIIRK